MSFGEAKRTNSQDKRIKIILQDTKEVAGLINQFVESQNVVKTGELVRYNNSYITKKYKEEANLIYKLKKQEIFFLIVHQSSIDDNIQYKIMNYCLDIMREWSKNKKIGKDTEYPIIVPIVIYTGQEEWKMPENLEEEQVEDYTYEDYKMNLEVNFINVNELSTKQLLESNTMIGYAMYLEKSQTNQELVENLKVVIRLVEGKRKLQQLHNMISNLLNDVLDSKTQEELLRIIEKSEKNN